MTRRIVATSPDPERARRLAAALAGVAGAEVRAMLDEGGDAPEAALWVVELDDVGAARERVLRVPGQAPVIAVLPAPDIAAIVEVMRSSERIVGVVATGALEPRELADLATRVVTDDVLALDRSIAPGTAIHSAAVADHRDKARCMARLAATLDELAVPRRYREPIEQCVDEMVMNALYDAPLDADGHRLFAGTSSRDRVGLRSDHSATVQYARDGQRFVVSVRDAFGSLERATVLAALHKGLHAAQPVESRVGGAGLGLYLMIHAATAVQFCVLPGIATEVICMFDLGAGPIALAELAFVVQADARGQRATGPARRLRARPWRRRLIAGAIAVIAAVGAVAGALALRGPVPHTATLEIDSQPTGAAVEIDGAPFGTTPVTVTSLAPGATVSIAFRRTGYRVAGARFAVPAAGGSGRLVQPLERADELVRVRFASTPPGAEVIRTGQPPAADRTYTPAELFVDAGQVQRFTLTMPGRVPLVIEPFTPARGERDLDKGGALVEGATLHIRATLEGIATVAGAPHCHTIALPADCALAPGSYAIEFQAPDGSRIARAVAMTGQDATLELEIGIVEAAAGRLLPGGAPRAVLEVGTHAITTTGPGGSHRTVVTVKPGATVTVD